MFRYKTLVPVFLWCAFTTQKSFFTGKEYENIGTEKKTDETRYENSKRQRWTRKKGTAKKDVDGINDIATKVTQVGENVN